MNPIERILASALKIVYLGIVIAVVITLPFTGGE